MNHYDIFHQGYETTVPVTMDDMIHHCKSVARYYYSLI